MAPAWKVGIVKAISGSNPALSAIAIEGRAERTAFLLRQCAKAKASIMIPGK